MSHVSEPPVDDDIEGHRLVANDNETIDGEPDPDVEGHRLAANDNETIVDAEEDDTPRS